MLDFNNPFLFFSLAKKFDPELPTPKTSVESYMDLLVYWRYIGGVSAIKTLSLLEFYMHFILFKVSSKLLIIK